MKQENNTGGVFSIAEMSLLLKISARSLAYWFDSNSGLGILPINKNKKSRKENLFSFSDMIEVYTYFHLKNTLHIKKAEILRSHATLSELFKTDYPFNSKKWLVSGGDILFANSDENSTIVKANGTYQSVFSDILDLFQVKLDFNDDGQAMRYHPIGKDHNILVDPNINYGSPVISENNAGTRIEASFIYKLLQDNSIADVKDSYNLSDKSIKDVNTFYGVAA
ncbi:MAG: hypothetical protein SGJ04_01135 [Bacteroidota bacterium]|nr:hypothetical protein [Bacteroidota bacterium]